MSPSDASNRRRSERVMLQIPVRVLTETAERVQVQEDTHTLVVNAHGALIALEAQVVAQQNVMLSNKSTQQSIDCRVVHIGSAQGGKTQVGMEFIKPSGKFWQIDFPPDDWVVPEN